MPSDPRHHEALFLGLLESSLDCILVMDAAGIVTEFNPAAERTFGWSRDEAVGRRLADLIIPPALREAHSRGLARFLSTGDAKVLGRRLEMTAIRKDGTEIPVELSVSRAGTAEAPSFIGAIRDITERRVLQEFHRVRQRELEEADRRKDEFMSMLAHELRNPLAPLMNATTLLKKLEHSPQSTRAIDVLDRQVRHMSRLVDDLLEVSRITRGKLELKRERVDLVKLVEDVCADRRDNVTAAGLRLVVELPDHPVFVDADATRLAQVFVNVIGNSTKFTETGGEIRVTLTANESSAVALVKDTGVGIEASVLPYVFEPFAQGDRTLQRQRGGLGLGLAVSKSLVSMHGGGISARSEGSGRGSEIRIELPLAATQAAAADTPAVEYREPASGPLRVLLIEDNEDSASTLRQLLETNGHQVRVQTTGLHAVDSVKAFMPDVVLCDLGLPDKDGFVVASEIRAALGADSPRLIAVTGYGTSVDRDRSRKAGFDEHLTKPVPFDILQRALTMS